MQSNVDLGGGLSAEQLQAWSSDGFLILRRVFSEAEMAQLQAECDRLLCQSPSLISPQNLRCRFMPHHQTEEPLFEVFDPVLDLSALLREVCFDSRILDVVASILQEPAELFKEKLIFKMPGARGYDLHQDIPQNWPGWPRSFLTVLVAIDPSSRRNGCTEVYRGYHDGFLSTDAQQYMLPADSVCSSRREFLELEPGDLAIFHGLTPHGSAANQTDGMRRAFYISYNARSDGGDQRQAHYKAFHQMLRQRMALTSSDPVWFR
ncbi:MAG: phytanoyl-CoA dioxygenase family protein [Planctomycetota bacterium]